MITRRKLTAGLATLLLTAPLLLPTGTAAASSSESDKYGASSDELIEIIDNAAENLEGPESRALSGMSDDQKVRVATILRDPDFAAPGKERALEERYPEVEVVEEFGNTDGWQAQPANSKGELSVFATGSRSSWVQQTWSIAGIRHTVVRTTVNYRYRGKQVRKINSCTSTYKELVPLRSVDRHQTQAINGDKTATCITNITLHRPLQNSVSGRQGLRVDGNGKRIRTWTL